MRNILVCILLLPVLNLYGQEKAYFSVSYNDAVPLGSFKSSTSVNNSGFAGNGTSVDGSFNYRIFKNFGLASMIRYQPNSFETGRFGSAYSAGSTLGYTPQTGNTGEWKQVNFVTGGYYLLPIGKSEKFTFESRAMIGIDNIFRPEMHWVSLSPNLNNFNSGSVLNGLSFDSKSATYSSKSTVSFSYLIGVGCRYNLTSRLYIFLRMDYSSAKPTFKNVQLTTTNTDVLGNTQVNHANVDITSGIHSLNAGLGAGLRLNKSSDKNVSK